MFSLSSEVPFTCAVCGKGFAFKSLWDRHMRCHTGDRPFKCPVCDLTWKHKAHLQRHLLQAHGLHTPGRNRNQFNAEDPLEDLRN